MAERVVLVHGSVMGGRQTWSRQAPLADIFDLVVVERPGFPPRPPIARVDFEEQARALANDVRAGDHLVGHSYGAVICLLTAAEAAARVRSLTVIEPPCTRVALADPAVAEFVEAAAELWRQGSREDPEAFLRAFLRAVGSTFQPPSPLPPELERGTRILMTERGPWEAEIPLEELASASFPTLVVSGGHHRALDRICEELVRQLYAEYRVLPGFGHSVQRHPGFNDVLADFVARASRYRER